MGLPPPDGPDRRSGSRRASRRPARAIGAIDDVGAQQTWRYRFPPQEHDIGRCEVRPGPPGAPGRQRRYAGWSARPRTSITRRGPSTCGGPSTSPSRPPSSRCNRIRTKDQQAASSARAHGSPSTASRRPGRSVRRVTCSCGARRGSASRPARRSAAGETGPRAAVRRPLRARPHDARHPGPTRLGQDLHRARDDLSLARRRQEGRHHRQQPQGHRQPARRGRRGRRRRRGVDGRGRSRSGDDEQVHDDRAWPRRKDPTSPRTGSTPAARTSPAGRPGCGRARSPGASTSCSSTRPARCPSPTSLAMARGHGQPRPARRSAAARPAAPGLAIRRARTVGARPPPRRRRRPCRPTAACSSRRPGGSIPDICGFTSEVFYEAASARAAARAPAPRAARRRSTGPASAPVVVPTRRRQRIARGGRAVAALVRALLEGGAALDRTRRRDATAPLTTSWSSPRTTPRSARSAPRLPAGARVGTVDKFQGQEAPISIYSMATSSAEDAPRGMDFLYSPTASTWPRRGPAASASWSPPALFVRARTPRADAPRQRLLPLR